MVNVLKLKLTAVIHFNSIDDILRRIPYGEQLSEGLNVNRSIDIKTTEIVINSQQKTFFMNNENFQFLTDNIKYAGFGETLKTELERNMNEGKPEFQLRFATGINKKPVEATLNFRKSESTDMYFFNNYYASL